jgi:hypothetical protein
MKKYRDVKTMFFAYKILMNIEIMDEKEKILFGLGFRYGRIAIISAIGALNKDKEVDVNNIDTEAKKRIKKVASIWNDFVNYIIKNPENSRYISEGVLDYDNYYKGRTVNNDIKSFFQKK